MMPHQRIAAIRANLLVVYRSPILAFCVRNQNFTLKIRVQRGWAFGKHGERLP